MDVEKNTYFLTEHGSSERRGELGRHPRHPDDSADNHHIYRLDVSDGAKIFHRSVPFRVEFAVESGRP